jgi:group I intron endonuclease
MYNQFEKITECAHIYRLVFPSGKSYIGQSWYYKDRFSSYKRLECKDQPKLYNALIKYGIENIEYFIIDMCYCQEELNDAENYWIVYYDSITNGYNCKEGGGNGKHTLESRRKIGESHKGRIISDEHKEKIRKSHIGKVVSQETRIKIGQKSRGRFVSDETKEKHRKSILGIKRTAQQKENNSKSQQGKKHSPEQIEKQRQSICKFTYKISTPQGEIIIRKNLAEYCRENNLCGNIMGRIANGLRNTSYKGYMVEKIQPVTR